MSLKIDMYISVADPAAPPRSPSLFLDQTEARREYLRVWMTAPTPPPLILGSGWPGAPLISRSGSHAAFCCFQPFSSLKYHTPSPARLRADFLIFPSYLLLRSLVGFVDERSGNEIVFPLFFLFLYIFYWFHFFFFGYLLYPFYFWDHSFNWDICQHIIAWAQNIFKAVYS